jgi:hypothetical protein
MRSRGGSARASTEPPPQGAVAAASGATASIRSGLVIPIRKYYAAAESFGEPAVKGPFFIALASIVGGREMARIRRHSRAIAAALSALSVLVFAPALAQDQGPNAGTDLYDRPVLAIDPGMHTAKIWSQAVDAAGRFAVTGSDDRTVRIWWSPTGGSWARFGFQSDRKRSA